MSDPREYLAKDYLTKAEMRPTRDGFGTGLVKLGHLDEKVVVLCADLTDSTRSAAFAKEFPERFIEMGVAEQNMMGVAAGMALSGKVPFISSYAVFNPGRNWDQMRVSVAYSRANVKIAGAHAGISVGPDGATHQALEDIAIARVLPNMTVIAPCDWIECEKATLAVGKMSGPAYVRFGRENVPTVTTSETPFEIGKALVLREGKDVTVVACGVMVYEALAAAEKLASDGIDVEVINSHTIKPLDIETIVTSARKTGKVVTAEEHQINGGLGGAVAEALSENCPVPMLRVGVNDTFGESGKPEELMDAYGLRSADIVRKIRKLLTHE